MIIMKAIQEKFVYANNRLNREINYIIQAFVNFYGEEYKDYIVTTLKDLKIIWYDDVEKQEGKNIKEQIASSLPEKQVDEYLSKMNKICFSQSAYIDEIDVLVLPLSYDITHIIHELNHKMSSNILSLEPLEIISGLCISKEKSGGVVSLNSDLNEAINQKMTLEILDELRNLGLDICYTPSWQENVFPLINLFYDSFRDDLKDIYITGNLNLFINYVGMNNYDEFSQLIYMKSFKLRRKITKGESPLVLEDDIKKIEDVVVSMKDFYNKSNSQNGKKQL